MKILIAADGSPHTKRMLAYIAAHDEWLGQLPAYAVIHSVLPVPPHAAVTVGKDMLKSYYESEAEKVFTPIRKFFKQQSLVARFLPKVGDPAVEIARLAETSKFDLVMIGSHGRGTLANLVLGSVVTKVLASCYTPVLIVR